MPLSLYMNDASEKPITPEIRATFAGPLLEWYRANKRDLPWRQMQDDAYAVWVSEIMLQQTQVATVIPYFERWVERFPTVESLASAPLEDALKLWAGLGYYARARNLHKAAQVVMERYSGQIPSDPTLLSALPGIGRYTAGAIRSVSFNQPAPIVDTNVIRVLSRVFALDGDPKSGPVQTELWQLAEALIPEGQARDFNQAVMELGATICSPADPACERCPLLSACIAGNSPDPTAWPQIPAGRATVKVTHCSVILREGNRYLIILRPPHGLWGGLWEFPRRVCNAGEEVVECAARAAKEVVGVEPMIESRVGTVKHGVTHHAITLYGFEGVIESDAPVPLDCAEVRWVTLEELDNLPLSAPQVLLVDALRNQTQVNARQGRLF
jgi:A/G-specific adenine glycosylase